MQKLEVKKITRAPVANTNRTVENVPFPHLTKLSEFVAYYGSEQVVVRNLLRMLWTDIRNKVRTQGVNQNLNLAQIEKDVLGYSEEGGVHSFSLSVGKGKSADPVNKAFKVLKDPDSYTIQEQLDSVKILQDRAEEVKNSAKTDKEVK